MLKQNVELGQAHKENYDRTMFQVSLLRCKKTKRVLFLEAGKDFVDTLLSFMLLPVGTILNLLSKGAQVKPLGGISSIFESVKRLDCSLLHVDKNHLVESRPAAAGFCAGSIGLLQGLETATEQSPCKKRRVLSRVYYQCDVCHIISSRKEGPCEECRSDTFRDRLEVALADLESDAASTAQENPKGFVKESITYMVTDSLEVMPSTTIRSINVLNELKVTTIADLESNDITVNVSQVLQLLQSALTSSTCLNDVFGKK